MQVEAVVTLKRQDQAPVGRERIRLLAAVGRGGSVTAGARTVGLSYKAAWDAIEAMTGVFGQPLLATRTGGRAGGGAALTPAGLRVIQVFGHLEAEMTRIAHELDVNLSEAGLARLNPLSGFLMRTSARNTLRGTIVAITRDELTAEVAVAIADHATIVTLVTNESLNDLALVTGRDVVVLVKATAITLDGVPDNVGARRSGNCLRGTVQRLQVSEANAEVVLNLGGTTTLAATITTERARTLGLADGRVAYAMFEAAHVILAID